MSSSDQVRRQNAKETIDTLHDLSQLLQTGLDKHTLSICVSMIEAGANPDSLAAVINELRHENTLVQPASTLSTTTTATTDKP